MLMKAVWGVLTEQLAVRKETIVICMRKFQGTVCFCFCHFDFALVRVFRQIPQVSKQPFQQVKDIFIVKLMRIYYAPCVCWKIKPGIFYLGLNVDCSRHNHLAISDLIYSKSREITQISSKTRSFSSDVTSKRRCFYYNYYIVLQH